MNQVLTPAARRRRLYWIGFTTFLLRSYQDILRYFILTIAPSAVLTALYLIIFGVVIGPQIGAIGGVDYLRYIAPGLIAMPIIATSYSHAALSFTVAKFHHFLDEHLISPLPGGIIVLSYVAGGMLRGILVGGAVGIIACLFTRARIEHPALMIGAMVLISLVCALAGFIHALFAKDIDQANWVSSFVLTPLTYCGGVFYSLSLLPRWAQELSLANPVFYMVSLCRYGMLGVSDISAGTAFAVMLTASLALFSAASALVERGIGIKD